MLEAIVLISYLIMKVAECENAFKLRAIRIAGIIRDFNFLIQLENYRVNILK